MSRVLYKVVIPEFKTHVRQGKTKWKKINGQSIYTSAHHRVRHLFMEQIHNYLTLFITPLEAPITSKPLEIHVTIYAPINYGDVRRIRGKVNWKPAKEDYQPSWDLDNFSWIWIKGMQDVLQKQNVIPDDTVKYIRKVSYEYVPVDSLDERKMVLSISHSDPGIVRIWKKLFTKNDKKDGK